jgi:hypothetical protein
MHRVAAEQAAPWQELSDIATALVGCGHESGLLMRRPGAIVFKLCATARLETISAITIVGK